jgi:hypothetical protein
LQFLLPFLFLTFNSGNPQKSLHLWIFYFSFWQNFASKRRPIYTLFWMVFPHEQLQYFDEEDDILFVVVTECARMSFCLLAETNLATWLSKFALKVGWVELGGMSWAGLGFGELDWGGG